MLNVNSYFDDKVKSIAFQGQELATTVGVMDIGEFTFGTSQFETMTVIDGELEVCLLYTSPSPRDGLLSRMPSSA